MNPDSAPYVTVAVDRDGQQGQPARGLDTILKRRRNRLALDHLHESERAILENPELYASIRTGLWEFAAGESVSSDWLFDEK